MFHNLTSHHIRTIFGSAEVSQENFLQFQMKKKGKKPKESEISIKNCMEKI